MHILQWSRGILPRHQIMSNPYMRLPFWYSCSYRFGELKVHALLCYSLVFPDRDTFFLSCPHTKDKPSGDSTVSLLWDGELLSLSWSREEWVLKVGDPVLSSWYPLYLGLQSGVHENWAQTMQFTSLGTDKWTFTNHNWRKQWVKGCYLKNSFYLYNWVCMQWLSLQVSVSPLTHTCLKGKQ